MTKRVEFSKTINGIFENEEFYEKFTFLVKWLCKWLSKIIYIN